MCECVPLVLVICSRTYCVKYNTYTCTKEIYIIYIERERDRNIYFHTLIFVHSNTSYIYIIKRHNILYNNTLICLENLLDTSFSQPLWGMRN